MYAGGDAVFDKLFAEQKKYTFCGTLYDNETGLPVSNVNVFLDGTQIGTATDANGKFELNVPNAIHTSLVFSHISYIQLSFPDPYKDLPDTIFLTPKVQELSPVDIIDRRDPFTRAEKMKTFKEQFLGMDVAGKACTIKNENDIYLIYNTDTKTLSANSKHPLLIENEYLAYNIRFELLTFSVTFVDYTLHNTSVSKFLFYGTAFFSNRLGDKEIERRREKIYQGSDLCFFKNFVNNTLKKSKFEVFNQGVPIDLRDYFTIQDTLSVKKVTIKPKKLEIPPSNYYQDVTGKISVLYNKKLSSYILFRTDSFMVDNFGYINMVDKIVFYGWFGQQRVGNMLPIDYHQDEKK
jgi:hypothetical protein